MTPFFCAREPELRKLLERGQWPQASPDELRAHVAGCRPCSELASVEQILRAARAEAGALPRLPSAGAIWWRAQLRRRHLEMERIGRPLLGAQLFALALTLAVAMGALAWEVRRGVHPAAWFNALHLGWGWGWGWGWLRSESLTSFTGSLGLGIPILAMVALVSGVVVYFASEKR
jgi:hypothetical protein